MIEMESRAFSAEAVLRYILLIFDCIYWYESKSLVLVVSMKVPYYRD
jgi:hypothetical protein